MYERAFVASHVDDLHADLLSWLTIPSISADPARATDVRRNAEWPAAEPDAKTVVVYGHHDVQPVDPEELWERPPFEPTIVGTELFARGASDDKGQLLFHLLAVRAHLAATGRTSPAVTLRFLIEGEEESGSPHFASLLRARRDRLDCDVIVVTDTGVFGRDTPSICMGMRGLADGEIHFHGPDVDLHSGSFGGAVPNPLTELARVLAAMHDENRVIQLPGFYDDVLPITDTERAAFGKLPFDEDAFLKGPAASRAAVGEAGYSTLERIWARPTAEINGFWGGYTGPGHKTIVPSDAYAKLSFRLVANQDPARIQESLAQFVRERTPAGIVSSVEFYGGGVKPSLSPIDHPATQAVLRSMGRAFDKEVLLSREGGSGPEADMAAILDAPLVFLGVGLPEDRIHAPNERVSLPQLYKGAEATAYLWSELAAT